MNFNFDTQVCHDLNESTRREWLETNGIGGFASSTLSGQNTRRYHGLLVASLRPPTHRFVLLSKLEEAIIIGDTRTELATNSYADGIVHPRGFELQTNFRLDPFPVSTFTIDGTHIEKTMFMLHGENTVVVRYHLAASSPRPVTLEVRPLVALRDYHSLLRADAAPEPSFTIEENLISVRSNDNAAHLFLAHTNAKANASGAWYKDFAYREEQLRGFDFHEDLFNPCALEFQLQPGETVSLIASTEPRDASQAPQLERLERTRRDRETARCPSTDEHVRALWSASTGYLVRRDVDAPGIKMENLAPTADTQLQSVIAGYHWFADWGRDTMISLPGLTLATRRFDSAREILLAFAAYLDKGLIPNNFPDLGDAPSYNTVDATLWYVHAVGEYIRHTDDEETLHALFPRLVEVIKWHIRGTHHNTRVDVDGLIRAGDAHVQLTWMDAKIGDYVVTPRSGRPVEIQALWYNALRTVQTLAARINDEEVHARCDELATRAGTSFNRLFWNADKNCLYDCIADDDTPDASVRPNQIFALSLPFSVLTDMEKARLVIDTVTRELLTPYGLRSLSPSDAHYRGIYQGDSWSRDTSYHQGTVWGWLIGGFISAYLKVYGRTPETITQAREVTRGLHAHLADTGLGHVSEIFDGDAPHTPRGCIAQAWSVAELLRCELEELNTA